jgi:hypothetical protein
VAADDVVNELLRESTMVEYPVLSSSVKYQVGLSLFGLGRFHRDVMVFWAACALVRFRLCRT